MIRKHMAAAMLVVALLAGACGGDGDDKGSGVASIDGKAAGSKSGSDGSNKSTEADREKAVLAFSRCMQANGVDMPDPDANGMMKISPGQQMPSQEAMQEAEKNCKAEREALQGSSGEPSKELQEKVPADGAVRAEQGLRHAGPHHGQGRWDRRGARSREVGRSGVQEGHGRLPQAS